MRHLPFVLLALLAASGSALAEDTFTPAVTYPAGHAAIEGRAIDILALLPGLSVQEMKAALAEHYAPDTIIERRTSFEVGSRGVTIMTGQFVDTVSAGEGDDTIEISFTGPASDNQAFAIERKIHNPDVLSAPTVDSISAALITKYGAPSMSSADGYQANPRNPGRLVWAYVNGQQVQCSYLMVGDGPGCTLLFSGYDPNMLQQIASDKPDFDYVIRADIWPHQDDISKTSQFAVKIFDFGRRHQAAQADTQALLAELERVHAEASQPAAAPAL